MKQFKGTPGPWHVGRELRIFAKDELFLARHSMGFRDDVSESNLCLIAAAPELLEALQDALHAYDKHGEYPEWDFARAAIAKALGETK